jgi:thiamine biosynthesis lipoprotein
MGVQCSASIVGPKAASLLPYAIQRASHLEQLWSRFLPKSDISRINSMNGKSIVVAPETVYLIRQMRASYAATNGLFNPSLLGLQLAAGDTVSLHSDADAAMIYSHHGRPTSIIDMAIEDNGTVTAPSDTLIDAGGIGKGLAADMIAGELLERGASGVSVNMGGDIRCAGTPPTEGGWLISITDPRDYSATVSTVAITQGAIATSSVFARQWDHTRSTRHIMGEHGETDSRVIGASVIANTCAWAETWTKAAILGDTSQVLATLDGAEMAALLIEEPHNRIQSSRWTDFETNPN